MNVFVFRAFKCESIAEGLTSLVLTNHYKEYLIKNSTFYSSGIEFIYVEGNVFFDFYIPDFVF